VQHEEQHHLRVRSNLLPMSFITGVFLAIREPLKAQL
jgi:hypothetical protein